MRPISWLVSLLAVLLPALAACAPPGSGGQQPTSTPRETAILTPQGEAGALRRDAEMMAESLGISVEEALRRLALQEPIGVLGATLEREQPETFAGLWIQHEPDYRVVVAFTRDGEETIRPYVEGTPIEDVIEVRTAQATLAELRAAQAEASRLLDGLGLSVSSAIDVRENRVELYVTDRPLFDAALQQAGVRLPDYVVAVTIYEPLGDELPFALTPVPGIHFPQLRMRSGAFMAALLEGELLVKDGCLRVVGPGDDVGHLIIWQPDYFLNDNDGTIEILDRDGRVVARVGEPIRLGGGEVPFTTEAQADLREPLPDRCGGPYWLMGEIVGS